MREPNSAYRWYVLALFTSAYVLNFVDRQILVILGPSLKADLRIGDAELGLLYGTAFALFYALFGLPLARVVDGWNRVAAMAIGLVAWSAATALSATAGGFGQLAALRAGVGVGEASASPAAFSILQDYFPPRRRATALAIYGSGIYIGIGLSLIVGGGILTHWAGYAPGAGPLGLTGWQAAYLAAGVPGLVLALLIALTVREPVRGSSEGRSHPRDTAALRGVPIDLGLFVPGVATLLLARLGAPRLMLIRHAAILAGCIAGAVGLTLLTDPLIAEAKRVAIVSIGGVPLTTNAVQWISIAVGIHAAAGWIAALRLRSPLAAAATVDDRAFRLLVIAGGVVSIAGYGIAGFVYVYGKQAFGLDASAGTIIGVISCIGGGTGTILGGVLADRARRSHIAGGVFVAAGAITAALAFYLWMLTTGSVVQFYAALLGASTTLAMWLGPIFATCQERVHAAQRGTATGLQYLGSTLIGLGLGPYSVGLISDATGNLRAAMLLSLLTIPATLILFRRGALALSRG